MKDTTSPRWLLGLRLLRSAAIWLIPFLAIYVVPGALLAAGEEPSSPPVQPQAAAGQEEQEQEASEHAGHMEHKEHMEHMEHAEQEHGGEHGHSPRLSDEAIGLQLDGFPERPKPILELGPHFLGTGTLPKGFTLPTGATWQPAFLAFGQLRAAVQSFGTGDTRVAEAVARLDLFGNLYLTQTERVVIGFRNFDQDGAFTSYIISSDVPGIEEGFQDELNGELSSLFFEGDFGEIFPNLSKNDLSPTDWGFAVGRQPLFFQEGMVVNDVVDGIGITRNTLLPSNTSNFRATMFYGWNNLHRTVRDSGRTNIEDDSAQLLALFTSTDLRRTTMDIDAAWLFSDSNDPADPRGDLVNFGVSGVQRLGHYNSSLRVLQSWAPNGETPWSTEGTLFFSELSWTPRRSLNLVYVNTFWALDDFSSISRDPSSGGPLGRAGINFAAVGLGNYGAPLSSQARDVAGGALGYQMFFANTRRQLIVELGARVGTRSDVQDQVATTARYQIALGRRFVVVTDAFVGYREGLAGSDGDDTLFGGRLELVTKF